MAHYLTLSDLLDLKLSHTMFNRPMYERKGYTYKKKDDGYTFYINTLGVNPEDIIIDAEYDDYGRTIVKISGKTIIDDNEYKVSYQLALVKEIEEVSSTSKNGLLLLDVKFKEQVKPKIKFNNN